jgi:2-polyprenyl-3-methyl-5-hydroxy-6-metoxy-1,4-benzoquinol methylase
VQGEDLNNNAMSCPVCSSSWRGEMGLISGYKLLICSQCGLWHCNKNDLESINYDEVYKSQEYQDEQFYMLDQTPRWSEFTEYPTYKPFFSQVQQIPHGKLLDIGCGVGRFCRAAYSKNWDVKGIDISAIAVAKGKQTAPFPIFNTTAEDYIKSGEQFDVVTAFEVLEHLVNPLEFLSNTTKLLKKGGTFFCTVPNIDSSTVRTATKRDWLPPIHVLFFSQRALYEALIVSGYTNIRSGIIWVNGKPSNFGLRMITHIWSGILGKKQKPDPLGLWAFGVKA